MITLAFLFYLVGLAAAATVTIILMQTTEEERSKTQTSWLRVGIVTTATCVIMMYSMDTELWLLALLVIFACSGCFIRKALRKRRDSSNKD